MKTVKVVIQGTVPLLQHRYQFRDEIASSPKKKSGSIDYSLDWIKALYWNKEIGLYQPSEHIEGAMIKSAGNFQIVGKGKRTYRDLIKSTVFCKPDFIPYGYKAKSPEELLEKKFISVHKAVVVVNRGRIERLRPMLPAGWKLNFNLEVFDDQLSKDALFEILTYAGKFIGLSDWRPRYGRFAILKFE